MTRNQQIRNEVLLQLYGAGMAIGVTPEHMARVSKRNGYDFTAVEMDAAALFLQGQGLAEQRTDAVGVVRYVITSKGVLEYERNGQ